MGIKLSIESTSPLGPDDKDLLTGSSIMALAIADHELAKERSCRRSGARPSDGRTASLAGSVRPSTIARVPDLDRHADAFAMGSSAREKAGGRSDVVSEGVGVVAHRRTMTQAPRRRNFGGGTRDPTHRRRKPHGLRGLGVHRGTARTEPPAVAAQASPALGWAIGRSSMGHLYAVEDPERHDWHALDRSGPVGPGYLTLC